jgi:hypothetical protein
LYPTKGYTLARKDETGLKGLHGDPPEAVILPKKLFYRTKHAQVSGATLKKLMYQQDVENDWKSVRSPGSQTINT